MDLKPAFYKEVVPEEFPNSTEEDRQHDRDYSPFSWPVIALFALLAVARTLPEILRAIHNVGQSAG